MARFFCKTKNRAAPRMIHFNRGVKGKKKRSGGKTRGLCGHGRSVLRSYKSLKRRRLVGGGSAGGGGKSFWLLRLVAFEVGEQLDNAGWRLRLGSGALRCALK
jgi:hypothetical protein